MRLLIILFTTHTALMYKYHNTMIVQVPINEDFAIINPLCAMGSEPSTFWLVSAHQGITFLARICILKC